MFTGIIETTGKIQKITPKGPGKRMAITFEKNTLTNIKEGDSISVSGVCSTARNPTPTSFEVDYLPETLQKTTLGEIKETDPINLETAATPTTKLGGHILSGHIDHSAEIQEFKKGTDFAELTLSFPKKNRPYLIPKGSIALDGISLTIATLTDTTLTVHLIPHTLTQTTLNTKQAGEFLNIEYDQLGKYITNHLKHLQKL